MHATAQSLLARLRQNPLDPGAIQALREYAEQSADVGILAEGLEVHARALGEAEGDPVDLGRLHFELGNLYRDKLRRQDRALAHYRAAIDFDAAQRPAMAAARSIYTALGKWDQVVKLLEREADSLPEGPKRAALLKELGGVYRRELNDTQAAIKALREASSYSPNDLHLRHELATQLLELADRETDSMRAEEERREAADVLCAMARAVSDDYAFAYVEAALDAVPDHQAGIELLEQIAPRVGRPDTIAPRWVAALQMCPDGAFARDLRIKLAQAYQRVGQLDDARVCLEPLIARTDPEALKLVESLAKAAKPPSEESLLDEDLVAAEASRADQMASDIAMLRISQADHDSPLEDLARLGRGDRTIVDSVDLAEGAATFLGQDANGTDEGDDELVSSSELSLASDDLASEVDAALHGDAPLGPRPRGVDQRTLTGDELVAAQDDELPTDDTPVSREDLLKVRERMRTAQNMPAVDLLRARDPFAEIADESSDASDPHGEVTQPRAGMSIPPEARKDATETDSSMADTPAAPIRFDSLSPESTPDTTAKRAPVSSEHARPISTSIAARSGSASIPPASGNASTSSRSASIPPASGSASIPPGSASPSMPPSGSTSLGRSPSMPPIARPRPSTPPEPSGPPETEQQKLRKELEKRIRFRDRRGAAEVAENLLAHDPTDAEAIAALEDHYRATRDFRRMRELTMRIARESGFPLDTRITRLREAGMLSESKLGDLEGTIAAFKLLLSLLPSDEESLTKLRRIYTRNGRWDELAQLIGAQTSSVSDVEARAALYRELGALHRDKRKATELAIEAFTSARELAPDHAEDEVALCDLYAAAGRYSEAALMLEARLKRAEEPVERVPLLRSLAEIAESQLQDDDRALTATDELLRIAPRDEGSVDRLERIAERMQKPERVIDALTRKLAMAEPEGQAGLYARIGALCFSRLGDAARAADAYREALTRTPDDAALWQAAEQVFDQAGQRAELTTLLSTLAHEAKKPTQKATLLRRLAERETSDGHLESAIQAYEQLLVASKDSDALRALVELLRKTARAADLAVRLDTLANLSEPAVARDLRLERARLFAEKLSRVEDAKLELKRVLGELAAEDVEVLTLLAELGTQTGDRTLYAQCEEQRMKLLPEKEARVEIAETLARVYEQELHDEPAAMRVLEYWMAQVPGNPQPYLRVVPLYERGQRSTELLTALDALATLAVDEGEAGEYLLRAARVAMQQGDYEGAWNRLVPRVVDANDAAAEALLRELARTAERGKDLAELYVGLAQRGGPAEVEKQRWVDAAEAYETLVQAPDKALEASLRALAKDLGNLTLLDQADRLAEAAQAWPRLIQVYDTMARRAEGADARVRILMRLAERLEHRANDVGAAFERVALAFQLEPARDDTYAEAKRLAQLSERSEDLLLLQERRAGGVREPALQIRALLEACGVAQHELADTPRATGYLSRAVTVAGGDEALLGEIEGEVRDLDTLHPPIDGRGLTHALTEVYKLRAEEGRRDASLAALLLSRAAAIFTDHLQELEPAYRVLERAATLLPGDEAVLDALVLAAERAGRFEALAEHFQRLADDAIDSTTASAALRRLGALYRGPLEDPSRAAEVYKQLVMLRPRDAEAAAELRASLKAAGRHKDLLIAIDRELAIASTNEAKVAFLKEAAETWEVGLQNRFEALDTWKRVLALAPNDGDAARAVERLGTRRVINDDSLLEGDLVVLPEDLHPTIPPSAPDLFAIARDSLRAEAEGASQAGAGDAESALPGDAQAPNAEAVAQTPGSVDPIADALGVSESLIPTGHLENDVDRALTVRPYDPPGAFDTDRAPSFAEDVADQGELAPWVSEALATSAAQINRTGGTLAQLLSPDAKPEASEFSPEAADAATSEQLAEAAPEAPASAQAEAAQDDEEAHAAEGASVHEELEAEASEAAELPPSGETVISSEYDLDDMSAASPTEHAPAPTTEESGEYADAFEEELEAPSPDTDPSELSQHASEAPQRTVPPAPPVPWAQADAPGEPPRSTRPELLAELESLDAEVETLEEADAEPLEEEDEQAPGEESAPTEGLASLSHMVERNAPAQNAKPRIPPPPPTGRPPAATRPPTAPPPVPNGRPATPIPPPPRRE
jgi:tetratricopeptide (TPR) repeat protein